MREAGSGVTTQRDAAGGEQPRDLRQRGDGVVEVLEHVGEHDRLAGRRRSRVELVERAAPDVEAEDVAGVGARRVGDLEARDLPAAAARLVEQQPVAAADVEHPPARRVALDRVEQAPRRAAAAGLLGQVGVVAHLAVEVVQLGAAGEVGLLDRPAARARVEVAVAADGVAAGGERVGARSAARSPR